MAATTALYRYTGAGPASASVAGGLKLTRDDSNVGTTPVPIPPVTPNATNFSYAAVVALYVTAPAAPASALTNFRVYQSGATTTGMQLFHNSSATTPATSGTYTQQTAAITSSSTTVATPPSAAFVAMTTSTSGTVFDSAGTGSTISAAGKASNYMLVVFGADNTATTTGTVTLPSINVVYDEQ